MLNKQRGSVSTEWVIVTMIMLLALFAPLVGGNQSVMSLFMDALRGFHQNSSFLLSLP
ncbi:MAG: hypothetical protein V3V18_08170 [Methylococcales bacterium]